MWKFVTAVSIVILPFVAMAQTDWPGGVQKCDRSLVRTPESPVPHVRVACPPRLEMSQAQIQTAPYDQLVAFLTSQGIGRRRFFDHFTLSLDDIRAMAMRYADDGPSVVLGTETPR